MVVRLPESCQHTDISTVRSVVVPRAPEVMDLGPSALLSERIRIRATAKGSAGYAMTGFHREVTSSNCLQRPGLQTRGQSLVVKATMVVPNSLFRAGLGSRERGF